MNLSQEEGMPRHGLSGPASVAGGQYVQNPFRFVPSASHLDQGPDYGPDHVAQESVGCDGEYQVVHPGHRRYGRNPAAPPGGRHLAQGRSGRAPRLLEAAEIVPSQQQLRPAVHGLHVQRILAVPGKILYERVLPPVDVVPVGTAVGISKRAWASSLTRTMSRSTMFFGRMAFIL